MLKLFIKISNVLHLNALKEQFFKNDGDGFSNSDKEYLSQLKYQNPFGIIVMFLGLFSFVFGPNYIFLPITTMLLFMITFGTFNYEKEDNPWVFHIGLCLAVLGLYLNFIGYEHVFI